MSGCEALEDRIAVGTVQFGLDYGISNREGKTSQQEVKEIVKVLFDRGIDCFDTAPVYGESESVLGHILTNVFCNQLNPKMITKTAHTDSEWTQQRRNDYIVKTFERSLMNLKVDSVYGLLVHTASDLLNPGGDELWNTITALRDEGKIIKRGVSVYHVDEIEQILDQQEIDMVQLPCSLIDQRFLKGDLLEKLHRNGVEIHSRSTFLQGLLLMEPDELPVYFEPFKQDLWEWRGLLMDYQMTPFEAALSFVLLNRHLDKVVLGCCNQDQWRSVLKLLDSVKAGLIDREKIEVLSEFAREKFDDVRLLNPAVWDLG